MTLIITPLSDRIVLPQPLHTTAVELAGPGLDSMSPAMRR